jgi:hypothetical protein
MNITRADCHVQILEFMAVTKQKHRKDIRESKRIKLRVIEIYYGFMDYIHCVTTGKTQQHSLSGRNAYAICKIYNSPLWTAGSL